MQPVLFAKVEGLFLARMACDSLAFVLFRYLIVAICLWIIRYNHAIFFATKINVYLYTDS